MPQERLFYAALCPFVDTLCFFHRNSWRYWRVSNPLLRDFTPSLDPVQLQHHDLVCALRVQLVDRALLVPSQHPLVMIQSGHMVGTLGIEPSDYDLIRIASSPVE